MTKEKDFANEKALTAIAEDTVKIKSEVLGIEVNSIETQAKAAELIAKIKGHIKQITVSHKAWVQSFRDVIKGADKIKKEKIEPLDKLLALVSVPYLAYQKELDDIAEEKELARLKAKAANDKIIADLKKKQDEAKTDKAQEKIETKIEIAENAPALVPVKEKPTVKTEAGSVTTSKRMDYEITNINELDPAYLMPPQPNRAKLRKAVNDGVKSIEGTRIFERTIIGGRSA